MKLETAIAIAVAGALAVPFAAQASAEADRIILAQQSGSTTTGAGAPVHGATNAADRPANTPKAQTGTGASGATATGGFAGIDKNNDGYLSRDEAKDATWSNRFTELDKDNDNRLSQSEFDAMQAGSGASAAPGAPLTGGSNSADRRPNTPKQ
jgi:hypothetical protein